MKKYLLISALCLMAACAKEAPETTPLLVVEGWIESDEAPVVMVTTSVIPTPEPQDISRLEDYVEKWARVAVWDGDKEVILTGMISQRYTPPFYFTTGRIIGEVGKTYRLTVDTDQFHAESTATIPEAVGLQSLEAIPYGDDGSQFLLKAAYSGAYHCKFFTLIEGVDKTYVPAFSSLATGSERTEVTIRPGSTLYRSEKRPSFHSGETVWVKCCALGEDMYAMWKALDDLLYLDIPAFFSLDSNLPGNVDGAIGYFAGYGCTTYKVVIP